MKFKNVVKNTSRLFQTFIREFLFVFRFSPGHAAVLTITQLLIGLIPAIEVVFVAKIVDELIAGLAQQLWTEQLTRYLVISLGLLGIQRIAFIVSDYVMNFLKGHLQVAVNDRIHRKLITLDAPTLERADVQTFVTYLKEQSWRPQQMVYTVFEGLGNIVASLSFITIAVTFSPFFLALFLLAVIPSMAVSIYSIHIAYQLSFGKAGLMNRVWYFDSLFRQHESLFELMVHNVGKFFADRYRDTFKKVVDTEIRIEKQKVLGTLVANVASFIIYIFVYMRILGAAIGGQLTIGQFTLYVGAFLNLERFMVSQVWGIASLLEHTKYLDGFHQLEQLQPVIRDRDGVQELHSPVTIELRNVFFSYPNSQESAVSDVSFVLRPGQRIALVGENGAGKSTIVKLILRLYEPTSGHILVNGKDYRSYSLASLRREVGVTFQDFLRYSLTVRENIGIGELRHMQEQPVIEQASVRAGIHGRVLALPKKYETELGKEYHEEGIELSGGEWQKVALARSLVKDASLLILDEPTAALDARSEYHFFQELFKRAASQSILLISHRFFSVRIADEILVLKDGKIIERGSHGSLMKQKGLYRELFELQTKEIT